MQQPMAESLLDRIEKLNVLGILLSAEKDHDRLLEMILAGAREITRADGGTLYLVVDKRELRFEIVQTASLGIAMGGNSGRPVTFPAIPLYDAGGNPNLHTVAARTALENRIINVPDVYATTGFDFSGTRAFDNRSGYTSRSFLSVPMSDHEGRLTGVLQLINAIDPLTGQIVPFSAEDERLVASLASQAAVTLNRKRLVEGLKELLDSLTHLIANAIDEKSPYTGGHCRRVPVLTMLLADAVDRSQAAAFATTHFDEKKRYELEMAAWLHDCGKLITPEHLIDKHTKLESVWDRIEAIDSRIEILVRDARIVCLEKKLGAVACGQPEEAVAAEAAMAERLRSLAADREFLRRCNQGRETMGDDDLRRLRELAAVHLHFSGEEKPLLSEDELRCLSISRGTLTDAERQIIEAHATSTIRMLETLPFPEDLKGVPIIAGGHHEKIDGSGYPRGLTGAQLSLQARILAIADIFEALTAADRPYRRPNTLTQALKIMEQMCRDGHLDADLFDLFIREKIYLDYATAFLRPEQIEAGGPVLAASP